MEIRLLGPVELRVEHGVVDLPRRQQRALLAALALRVGEVVSTDRLVVDLWGERPPASATGSLQNAVSELRKLLGRDVLVTHPPGYRLALDATAVDAHRFERLVAEAQSAEPERRATLLAEALRLWRGAPLADLGEREFARLTAARLEELRLVALEERIDAELVLGRHAALVAELEDLVRAEPQRERPRAQLMLALYRCGRQAEALEVYRATRLALADELGLDPSPELQELERRILRQDPSLAAPTTPRGPVEAGPSEERRLVSVLAAIPPTDEDAETLRRRLDEVLATAREVLAAHGGELERFGPEGLVAVFGGTRARDDDALRAAAAARELGLPAGVATGETVGGAGAVFARAAELARGDGVRLDERTRELVEAVRHHDAPLVGRERELTALREELAAVREERRCRVVTVLGEAGIGKSRLAREFVLGAADEVELLVARCSSSGAGATFLPLLGALERAEPSRALAAEPDRDLVVERLAALADETAVSSLGESYWAVRRLLEALAGARPVLLVLDDVHWAEQALLDLVDYLAGRVEERLLVLCLARPELERTAGAAITLEPLAPDEARLIAGATAALDEPTRERIVELAEGNPLYLQQLAAYSSESAVGLPATLEAVLAGRLGQVDAAERTLLQRASVLGREFTRGGVATLADGAVDAALASLSRRGFIRPVRNGSRGDDAYLFHHVLLRDAAYRSLTRRDRARLHEEAAGWLAGRGDDAVIGWHLEQAALCLHALGADGAAQAKAGGERLAAAGMHAWRRGDVRAATGLFARAAALLPAGDLRAEVRCELSIGLALTGDDAAAAAALELAAADARGRRLTHRVALERSVRGLARGETTRAELARTARAAIATFEAAGDDRSLGRAWMTLYEAELYGCRYEAQLVSARNALEHYRRARFSPALCFDAIGSALLFGPTPVATAIDECTLLLDEAADRRAEANVLTTLAALAAMERRFADAERLEARAGDAYADVGLVAGSDWKRLVVLRRLDDLDGAIEVARRGAAREHASGTPATESSYRCQEADALLAAGRVDEAAAAVRAVRKVAIAEDVYVQSMLRSLDARVRARRGGDGRRAARAAVELLPPDAVTTRADALLALAEVSALASDADAARSAAAEADALLRAKGDLARAELAAGAFASEGPRSRGPSVRSRR